MARDHLLECLLLAFSRPHRKCLRQAAPLQQRCLRYASTNASGPSKPAGPRLPSNVKVPLHVGLDRNPEHRSAISKIPIPKGEKGEVFTPSVLARPLGLQYRPQVGQNSPIDKRTKDEKKRDLKSHDQVLERRQKLMRSFFRPYFQDRKYVNYHEGKSFVSNERLFKRDKALYFPNIWGETLSMSGDGPDGGKDTTALLSGKISIVAFHGPRWAELHVDTFLSPKANPELEEILQRNTGLVQLVNINIQDGIFNQWIVKMFKGQIRKTVPENRWDKYFLIQLAQDTRRGLTEDIRDAMGLLNKNVGYVYLLDPECHIRWAGSGNAWSGEVKSLNTGLKRLIQEVSVAESPRQPANPTKIHGSEITPGVAIPA